MKYVLIASWIGCGLIGAGFDNAYFQRKWKDQCEGRRDFGQSLIMVPLGPINAVVSYLLSGLGEYGWSLKMVANEKCKK